MNVASSPGASVRPDDGIEAIPSLLGFLGYRHHWSRRLRSNLNLAGIAADPNATFTGGASDRYAYSVSANLIYSPIPDLSFGAEIIRAYRELEDGTNGKMTRLQFAGRYNFSFTARSEEEEDD